MGQIASVEPREGGIRVWIEAGALADETATGDSVAVDGCCLTVVDRDADRLAFDAVPETLRRTTLGARGGGDGVNLELPLKVGDRFGGHFVQGHVDAVTDVLACREAGDEVLMTFALPEALAGQVIEKGSITVDGVSLTVAALEKDRFTVALIPHTLQVTTLGARKPGDRVNLEGDVLAKYVAALVGPR